jgi:DNA-directed RNA polymerase omega subunit
MSGIVEVSSNVANEATAAEWPGIVSRFQLVILATHRSKQLLRGAEPRIVADRFKRRNTSIALEELKRGLIFFKPLAMIPVAEELVNESPAHDGILESTIT